MDPDAVSTTSGTLTPNYDFSRSGNTSLSLNSAVCRCSSSCATNVSSDCYSCTQSVGYVPGIGPNVNSTDQGEYFGTERKEQLGALFSMVAKQILLRLGS
jgi:hypothetical protein